MNNLAIILEQVLEARKIATEQLVVEQLDQVIQTIIDMMKAEPKSDLPPINLPPINYPPVAPQPIPLSPYGGLEVWCVDQSDVPAPITNEDVVTVNTRARALAEKLLGVK